MPNPLFNSLNGQRQGGFDMGGLVQRFKQFRQNFLGDPRQKVQELLNSGRMTQDQFNRLRQMASQFQGLLH